MSRHAGGALPTVILLRPTLARRNLLACDLTRRWWQPRPSRRRLAVERLGPGYCRRRGRKRRRRGGSDGWLLWLTTRPLAGRRGGDAPEPFPPCRGEGVLARLRATQSLVSALKPPSARELVRSAAFLRVARSKFVRANAVSGLNHKLKR